MGRFIKECKLLFPALSKGKCIVIAFKKNRRVKEFIHDITKDPEWNWDKGKLFAKTKFGDVKYMGEDNNIPYFILVEGVAVDVDLFNKYKPRIEDMDLAAYSNETWDMAIATEKELRKQEAVPMPQKKIPTWLWIVAILVGLAFLWWAWSNGGIINMLSGAMGAATERGGSAGANVIS